MILREWIYPGSHDFYDRKLKLLATNDLPPEKWSYSGKEDFGILRSYLSYTFEKLWQEREIVNENERAYYIYVDDKQACFNTGLYDKSWQPIYYYCTPNPRPNYQPWQFTSFYNSYTIKYTGMSPTDISSLRRPNYFEDPSALIFDVNLPIVPQWEHILYDEENYMRIPEQIRNNGRDFCQNVLMGSITSVKKRIEANYKTIVPQWYRGKIQLLAPLYMTNPDKPELALVLSISEDHTQYYGHTCLTTEMAYNNARVIARPESYWLQP